MMSAEACGAKAVEMDRLAGECFSAETADMYRSLADEWRCLRVEALAHEASTGITDAH